MAAPVYDMSRNPFAYHSDDGNVYTIGTTDENGSVINGAAVINPASHPRFPRGWKPRAIFGVYDDTGTLYRTSVPIFLASNALFVGGTTTFDKGGQTFTVEGKRGEQRYNRGV